MLPTWQDQIAVPALRPRLIFRFLPIATSAINQRSTIKHEDSTTFVFTGSMLVTKEFTQVKNGSRNLLICIYISGEWGFRLCSAYFLPFVNSAFSFFQESLLVAWHHIISITCVLDFWAKMNDICFSIGGPVRVGITSTKEGCD